MRATRRFVLITLSLAVLLGCASRQTFQIPPRIDLQQLETIGIIEFSSSSKGELAPLATRRFTELARRDQGLVRIVGFGRERKVLKSLGSARMDPATIKALGREHGVSTLVMGELTVSKVKPGLRLAGLRSGSLSARVDATLEVEMIETATGASIWNASASASQGVGQVSVFGGKEVVFDAEDPELAYGALVDSLVTQVTQDFQVSWERR